MLDVRKLRALREVALRQSFSEAAERLGYTQSAISQQISQLERQVGTQLLDRRGRGVRLTPAGRTLVDCADAVLRRLVDAESELEAITGIRQGSLRVATCAMSTLTWLPAVVRRFRARYPAVRLCLTPTDGRTGAGLVRDGEADIAVVGIPAGATFDAGLARIPLFTDPLRLAGRASLALADLAEDPWIVAPRDSPLGDAFADLCLREGVKPRVAIRADDWFAVHGLVAAGLGVAFLPAIATTIPLRDDVVTRPLHAPEPVRQVAALLRAGIERSPAVVAMLTDLQTGAATYAARREGGPAALAG
jgi:DNA-binding transcriptional LysR family regulator